MKKRPRVRKAKATVASWIRPVAVFAATAVFATTGAWAAWDRVVPYVTDHDYFRLRTIRISSDETRVAPQNLAEIAGLYDDASLWDVDPDAIERTLSDASWVRDASVVRHFPWQVSLSVSRRQPVAATIAGGKAHLVDASGVLFHEIEEAAVPDLPYLTGWDAVPARAEQAERLRALLGVLEKASGRDIEVSELHMSEDGTVWLYATGIKASVRIGEAFRANTAFDRLAVALAELGPLADRARVIDTDYRDRIVIRGADDKLPAMLAARDTAAPGETSDARLSRRADARTPRTGSVSSRKEPSAHGRVKAGRHG